MIRNDIFILKSPKRNKGLTSSLVRVRMVSRDRITEFLHEYLRVDDFEDHCVNGIQVEGKKQISKIILGVTASKRLFSEALERKGDMIIVHHGLFWKKDLGLLKITGWMKERISILLKSDINLAAYHLPLDAHPEVGNNIQIINRLSLEVEEKFDVGYLAQTKRRIGLNDFVDFLDKKIGTSAITFPFGKKEVKKLLIISGASGKFFEDAGRLGADTFITGGLDEYMIRIAEEIELNLINIGHYNSEKLGVQALGERLEKEFSIEAAFIDIPNIV